MLQHCWALQMMHKGSVDHLAPVWQLRSHMAFLIDKIQYYVQVDVIESQFSLLLENIQLTQDFETIQQAHCNFVSSLYRQLFLQATSVSICHTHICRYAHSLCRQLWHHFTWHFSEKCIPHHFQYKVGYIWNWYLLLVNWILFPYLWSRYFSCSMKYFNFVHHFAC